MNARYKHKKQQNHPKTKKDHHKKKEDKKKKGKKEKKGQAWIVGLEEFWVRRELSKDASKRCPK